MTRNGTMAKWILVGIAIAGIVWNAATLHNDVKHIEEDIKEIRQGQGRIMDIIVQWEPDDGPD